MTLKVVMELGVVKSLPGAGCQEPMSQGNLALLSQGITQVNTEYHLPVLMLFHPYSFFSVSEFMWHVMHQTTASHLQPSGIK